MKHLKKYNESTDKKELDKQFFEMVFEDLIENSYVLEILDDCNFFKDFYNDGRKGTDGGVLISLKCLPSSHYIENYIKEIDEYKEVILDLKTCIRRVEDEFPGVEHYMEQYSKTNENMTIFGGDILLYFWYKTPQKPRTQFTISAI